jgi:hypothetical protein
MTNKTTSTTAPTTGLRGARAEQAKAKAAAKKAPETPAFKVTMAERRAPAAKKAPVVKAAPAAKKPVAKKVEKATGPKRTFEAVGRCGSRRTTQSTAPAMWAIDVADDSAPTAKARTGQIWGFAASAEAAQKAADRAVAKGYDAKVVPAQLVAAEAVA